MRASRLVAFALAVSIANVVPIADAQAQNLTTLTIRQVGTIVNADPATASTSYTVTCVRTNWPAVFVFAATTSAAAPVAVIGAGKLRASDTCTISVTAISSLIRVLPLERQLSLTSSPASNNAPFTATQRNRPPVISAVNGSSSVTTSSGYSLKVPVTVADPDLPTAYDVRVQIIDSDLDGAGPDGAVAPASIYEELGHFAFDDLICGTATCTLYFADTQVPRVTTLLSALTVQTRSTYTGSFVLRVTVSDRGATGFGGPLSGEFDFTIRVVAPQREMVYPTDAVPAETFNLGSAYPTVTTQRFVVGANCKGSIDSVWVYQTSGETSIRLRLDVNARTVLNRFVTTDGTVGWKRHQLGVVIGGSVEGGETVLLTVAHPTGRFATRIRAFTGQSRVSPTGCLTSPASTPAAPNALYQYSSDMNAVGTLLYEDSEYYISPEISLMPST